MKKRPGGNLPDDVKQKLEEIRAKLEKFLEQQKKVIEASRKPGQEAGRGLHRQGEGSCSRGWRRPKTIGRSS